MNLSLAKPKPYSEAGRPWYDVKKGIAEHLATLKDLNFLLKMRYNAGYQKGERFNEFYLFGIYWLDTCGNCAKGTENLKIKFPEIPDVMTREEFWAFVEAKFGKEQHVMSFENNGGNIPPDGLKCAHCQKAWTLEDCFDTVVRRETQIVSLAEFVGKTLIEVEEEYSKKTDAIYRFHPSLLVRNDDFIDLSLMYPNPEKEWQKGIVVNEKGWMGDEDIHHSYVVREGDETGFNVWKFYHQECNRLDLTDKKKNEFQGIFERAGFKVKMMTPIKNEYCQCEVCAPWFLVDTQYGQFKIGWRKRVINLEWINVEQMKNFWQLFTREDVTKWKTGIHAWGDEKAEEYLKRIFNYLKRFKPN